MRIYEKIEDLIGGTPLLRLNRYAADLPAELLAKLELFNPAGSAKDRIALKMLDDAIAKGIIGENPVIIEPTSGNTGIGLACVCASRGYRAVFTMPDTMSIERRKLLAAYGAQVVLTPGKDGMLGAIAKAEELASKTPGSFVPSQFTNPSNPEAHRLTTGVEIWNDTDGEVDIFIAGVGTGGTISGVGEYLKSKNPKIKIIAVEPSDSPVLSEGRAGAHKIQGIGAGFVPDTLNRDVIDEVIAVTIDASLAEKQALAETEGVLVGISSGAVLAAAKILAVRGENAGKKIVALLPDTGERYLSN